MHLRVAAWWTIEHGSVLFIMLNSELEIGPGSDQADFLTSTLAGESVFVCAFDFSTTILAGESRVRPSAGLLREDGWFCACRMVLSVYIHVSV